jgi:hypothetical protein
MQIDRCFDASGFLVLTARQNQQYREAWDTFNRIQSVNSNVSTLRAFGRTNIWYYNYVSNTEKMKFIEGQSLHMRIYPSFSTLWQTVEKN